MIDLFIILFLITVIATVVFLFKPALTQFKNRPALSRKTIAIGGTIFSFILLFIIGTIAPTPPKPAADDEIPKNTAPAVEPKIEEVVKPEPEENMQEKEFQAIKGYNKAILAVRNHGNNVLEIDLPATEVAFSDAGYIDHTSRTTRDILIKILKNSPKQQFSTIRFVIFANLTDQYNNTENKPIFQLTYDYAEIKKISLNDGHVDHRLFMNFATFGLRSPVAHEMFEQWCAKDDNAERSGRFCK